MSHKKDEVELRTESVLRLDWVSFEKQTNTNTKNPWAAQNPSFRWKCNYGDWGERSDVIILQQSSIHTSSSLFVMRVRGCQKSFHSKSPDAVQTIDSQGCCLRKALEHWGLSAPSRGHLRAESWSVAARTHLLIWHPVLRQWRCQIWGNL